MNMNYTNIINLQQELDILRKRYELLVNNSVEGFWDWDINANNTFFSDKLCEILGIDKILVQITHSTLDEFVHPDDKAVRQNAISKCLESGGNYYHEYRLRVKSGEYRYYSSRGKVELDSNNKPIRLFGTFVDIHENKSNEQNLKLYEYVIENTLTPVVWINKEGIIVKTNKSYLDMLGYDDYELVGLDMSHLDDEYNGLIWDNHWKDLEKNTTVNLITKNKKKDGTNVTVSVVANFVKIGDVELNCAFITDVTDKLAYELKLKENERVLNTLVENIPVAIQFLDKDGKIFKYNKGYEDLFGINHGSNEIYGFNVLQDPLMKELGNYTYYQDVYDNKKIVHFESTVDLSESEKYGLNNSFKSRIVKNTTFPIIDNNGEIDFVASIMEDVTETRFFENALIESKSRLIAIIESTKDIVFALDKDFNYLAFNQNHFDATKAVYGSEVKVGEYMLGFITIDSDREFIENNLKRALNGEFVSIVQEFGDIEYEKLFLEANINPIKSDDGEETGVAVFVRDITKRVRAENETKELSNRLKAVIESTKDRMYALDTNLNFLTFNQNFFKSIKNRYGIEIKVGTNFIDILHNRKDKDFVLDIFNRGLKGESVEIIQELITKDDVIIYLEVVCNPIFDSNNEISGVAVFVKDITDKRLIELALQESEQRFRKLLNDVPNIAVQGYNRDGSINYWNKASETFFGYNFEEVKGKNIFDLLTPEYLLEKMKRDSEWMFDNRTPMPIEECDLKRKDGELITVLESKAYLESLDGTPEMFFIDVDLTKIKKAEIEIKELVHELMEKNELVELNLEQKKSLLEQLEITNHKLNDIIIEKDKLFSIIAHDLRSPLSGFMALSKELSDNIEDLSTEQIVEFANSLKNSSENVYLLLENLLKWSQLQRGTIAFVPEIIYLKYIVDNNISVLLSKSVSKDIELVSYINSETHFIADVNMFNVILRNLLSNAIKFTPRLGKIEIGVVDLDSKYYTNENITIYIKDSGIGIPKDMIEDLFKVNSKNYRNGTENESSSGLGLVLCKEFVAKHNGNIYVESIENIGTTFFVSLPLSQ